MHRRSSLALVLALLVTTPALAVMPFGVDMRESIRALSPSAG